ncbi:COG4705 family protein [Streptomyces sp. NPDC001348]
MRIAAPGARTSAAASAGRLAVKVPEITALFWVVKILTTGMGETFSDFLVGHLNPGLALGSGATALAIALIVQFRSDRYHLWIYWSAVTMVAVFGTMVADALTFLVGLPYPVTTVGFSIVLAVIFVRWYAREKTLDVHSITTPRRERFYWSMVTATFVLGTVAGDLTADMLHLGYLGSIVVFAIAIAVPAAAHRWAGLGTVTAFWSAYVITRPLGASITDWLSSSRQDGLGLGFGWVSLGATIVIVALLGLLTTRGDRPAAGLRSDAVRPGEADASM